MKWATRELVHFDRVASAWLISRFVDRAAQFAFLRSTDLPPDGAITFGFEGAKFGAHDDTSTTFSRLAATYCSNDRCLEAIAGLVSQGVNYVMEKRSISYADRSAGKAVGLLELMEGVMLMTSSDEACIEQSLPIYDALYARFQAEYMLDSTLKDRPATILQKTILLSKGIYASRVENVPLSEGLLENIILSLPTD